MEGIRQQLPVTDRAGKPVNIKEAVLFAGQDDRRFMLDYTGRGDMMNFLPSNKFIIDVDTALVLSNGTVKNYFRDIIQSPVIWEYTEEDAFKGDLAIMDLLATNNWERPIYFSTTVPSSQYKGLEKFFVQEGMAYRIVPINTGPRSDGEFGIIDTEVMFDNMMNKFEWGNAADSSVYLDENNRRMFSNFRRLFGNLAIELLEKGDTSRALLAIKRSEEVVPSDKIPDDFFSVTSAEVLLRAGQREEAEKLIGKIINYSKEYLDYAIRSGAVFGMEYPTGINMQALLDLYRMAVKLEEEPLITLLEPLINNYYGKLYSGKQ
jgi:hypothetical protein